LLDEELLGIRPVRVKEEFILVRSVAVKIRFISKGERDSPIIVLMPSDDPARVFVIAMRSSVLTYYY